ncbi:MAG: DUF11 domain-containing protein, partial [Ardenticatenales bacterium]|nr:DUF11 domain-containing protein [Ardenticatenales bacterium]
DPATPPVRRFPTQGALGLALESPSQEAVAGQVVTYDLVIGNQQQAPLTSIVVRETLVAGLVYLPGNPATLSYAPNTREILWQVAALQPGEVVTATFQVRVQGTPQSTALLQQVQATAEELAQPVESWSVLSVGRPAANERWLLPQGGTLHSQAQRLSVHLPAQALRQPARLRLNPAPAGTPPLSDTLSLFQLTLTDQAARTAGPLAQPLRLTAELRTHTDALRAQGRTPTFYRLNPATRVWEPLASRLDWEYMTLSAEAQEPGIFALSTTSTSDLSLSYGKQHLPTMQGFTSDATSGNSSFGFPLDTPPGPGGRGINLSLSYSSDGANSILAGRQDRLDNGLSGFYRQADMVGWGWNLNGLGQISYDRDSSEYSLGFGGGGFELVKPADPTQPWQTSPQSFLRVIHNNDAARPSWTVYGTDGTRYIFGNPDTGNGNAFSAAVTYNGIFAQCGPTELREAHLTRIIDPLGNEVRVTYTHQKRAVDGAGCTYDHAIEPESIQYFASGSQSANAQILFSYTNRPDTDIEPWLKTNLVYYFNLHRLESVTMQARRTASGPFETVRSYHLTHDYDTFNGSQSKSLMRLRTITERGSDGTALPAWTFDYERQSAPNPVVGGGNATALPNLNVLTKATNGQGGTVSYGYELLTGLPYAVPSTNECYGQGTARLRVTQMVVADGLGNSTATAYESGGARAWSQSDGGCDIDFEFSGYAWVVQTVTRTLGTISTVEQKVETQYHTETEEEWATLFPTTFPAGHSYEGFAEVKGKAKEQRILTSTNSELQKVTTTWRIQENEGTWVYP